MARQIIVLNVVSTTTVLDVAGVFWLTVPANLAHPNPSVTSQVPPVSATLPWGITAAELTALQAGTTIEQPFDTGQQPGTSTLAQAEAFIQGLYTAAQAQVNAMKVPTTKYVGGYFDGSVWTFPP